MHRLDARVKRVRTRAFTLCLAVTLAPDGAADHAGGGWAGGRAASVIRPPLKPVPAACAAMNIFRYYSDKHYGNSLAFLYIRSAPDLTARRVCGILRS
jgi:hypothetical protein